MEVTDFALLLLFVGVVCMGVSIHLLILAAIGLLNVVTMSLLTVGLVMFGGTDGIISYIRAWRLLAHNHNSAR